MCVCVCVHVYTQIYIHVYVRAGKTTRAFLSLTSNYLSQINPRKSYKDGRTELTSHSCLPNSSHMPWHVHTYPHPILKYFRCPRTKISHFYLKKKNVRVCLPVCLCVCLSALCVCLCVWYVCMGWSEDLGWPSLSFTFFESVLYFCHRGWQGSWFLSCGGFSCLHLPPPQKCWD